MQIVSKIPAKGLHSALRRGKLSKIAEKRLSWMDFLRKGHSIAECARHFCESDSTVSFWYKRFNPADLRSLENKSRKPHRVRTSKVSHHILDLIVSIRKALPMYGKIRIQNELGNTYNVFCGQSRIQKTINDQGLKRTKKSHTYVKRNRKHMYSVPNEYLSVPGGLVYLDTKHVRPVGGTKYYVFVAKDHATKTCFAMASSRITAQAATDFLSVLKTKEVFMNIRCIGTDNGSEFLGVFNQTLQRQSIEHVFTTPRSPKQNPFAERMIRTIIEEEFRYHGVQDTVAKQQQRLEIYLNWYNTERQHSALNYQTPNMIYQMLIQSNTT